MNYANLPYGPVCETVWFCTPPLLIQIIFHNLFNSIANSTQSSHTSDALAKVVTFRYSICHCLFSSFQNNVLAHGLRVKYCGIASGWNPPPWSLCLCQYRLSDLYSYWWQPLLFLDMICYEWYDMIWYVMHMVIIWCKVAQFVGHNKNASINEGVRIVDLPLSTTYLIHIRFRFIQIPVFEQLQIFCYHFVGW